MNFYIRGLVWALVAFGVTTLPLFSQATGDVTFYGSLNPRPGPHGSCWGYVTPDGREYALLGANGGTSIIDINNLPLREVGFIPGPSSQWRELKTYMHYAYVVSEGGAGVQIIDLSNPDSARLVRSFTYTGTGGRNINRSHAITIADGYMYLNGSAGWNPGGVLIFSLAVPDSPRFVGEYQPEYIHDSYVRNDTLYAAAIYNGGGLHIVNVTNKTFPQLMAKITYPGSGTHNAWATVNGKYAYTTDEIGSTVKNMKIWDISNLPQWRSAGSFTPRPGNTIHNVHGRGKYAYISHYGSWMIVADVHNDTIPVERGSYRTSSSGINWGVYPYFPSGKWISSDGSTGLFVCRFAGLRPRARSALFNPADDAIVNNSSSMRFTWQAAADKNEDPHYYRLRIWGPGVDTMMRAQDTSLFITNTGIFQQGQTYRWHVWIMDEYTRVSSRDTFQFLVLSNAARLATTTDSMDFGSIPRDSTNSLSIGLSNIGSGNLSIDSIRSTNAAFAVASGTPIVLPPDSSMTIAVLFSPTDTIRYQGALQIFSNSHLQPRKDVTLLGRGGVVTGMDEILSYPATFRLEQNYPNPFNPGTTIRFALPATEYVEMHLYNLLGEVVTTLVKGIVEAGHHQVSLHASGLPSGIYFYRLNTASGLIAAKKLIILK